MTLTVLIVKESGEKLYVCYIVMIYSNSVVVLVKKYFYLRTYHLLLVVVLKPGS